MRLNTSKANDKQTSNEAYLFWVTSHIHSGPPRPPGIHHLLRSPVTCSKYHTDLAVQTHGLDILSSPLISLLPSPNSHFLSWMMSLKGWRASTILSHFLLFLFLCSKSTYDFPVPSPTHSWQKTPSRMGHCCDLGIFLGLFSHDYHLVFT